MKVYKFEIVVMDCDLYDLDELIHEIENIDRAKCKVVSHSSFNVRLKTLLIADDPSYQQYVKVFNDEGL